jgi:hypothetical protein
MKNAINSLKNQKLHLFIFVIMRKYSSFSYFFWWFFVPGKMLFLYCGKELDNKIQNSDYTSVGLPAFLFSIRIAIFGKNIKCPVS